MPIDIREAAKLSVKSARDSHVLVIYHQSEIIAFYVPGYFM